MPLTVRRAVEGDTLGLFKLCVQMHRETDFAEYQFNPEKCVGSLAVWIGSPCTVPADFLMLVAERDGEVVGMMAASKKHPWFSDDVMVSEDFFYVRPDARGSRAAYLLMRGFVQWAVDIGAQHLRAGVATGSGPAGERLYQKFGMTYVGGNFSAHLERSA